MIAIPNPVRVLMDHEPLLRTVSAPVAAFGVPLQHLIAVMRDVATIRLAQGLAAVQIGVPVRVLIIRTDDGRQRDVQYRAFINPTLERTLNRFAAEREGCLSVPPRKWGDVSRPAKCDATWFDETGDPHSATLTGNDARIFQHEFDHLNGVLMTDRLAA